MHSVFTEISLLIVLAATMSVIMRALKQPLIIGHILTGLIVGPALLGIVNSPESIELLGNFGIALLLFIVGLGLNPKVVKEVGKVSLLTGLGQVVFTSAIGFWLVTMMGYAPMTAFYIAVALTFSSTIIILKLLSDKKEQNKLYGKIAIGFLLVQDIVATFALVIASATGQGGLSWQDVLVLVVKGLGLAIGTFLAANLIVKRMSGFLAKSQELLFLFALAWGFGIGTLFYEAGFSLEVGALVAGVAFASMPYAQEIGSRLRPLRDFFIVVFFIALGAKLNIDNLGGIIGQAIGLSLFVLVGNPIIVMSIMGVLGYTKKTSFNAGLAVAQISEFSLIFMILGQKNGQVDESAVTLVTLIGIITIALSSYMIIYSESLYKRLSRYLGVFERKNTRQEKEVRKHHEAVLFGYRHGGSEFVRVFKKMTKRYVVVDYDPEAIERMEHAGIPYLYGDATDLELLEEVDLSHAKLIVSNLTDHPANTFLLSHLEQVNPTAVAVCHADTIQEAAELYGLGASYVMMPHYIGTEKITSFIRKSGFKKTEFNKFRSKHLEYLQNHYDEVLNDKS